MPTAGTQILNGTVVPTGAIGATGDFYLDTAGKILYGPKSSGTLGPDEQALNPATPPQYPSLGSSNQTFGLRVTFVKVGAVSALRFYRPSTSTATSRTLALYRAGVLAATTTSSGESGSGWMQVPLAAPVAVDTGVTYTATYHSGGSTTAETDSPNVTQNPSFGADITIIGSCYGSGNAFPVTNVAYNYLADLVFNAGIPPWPLAIKSA